MSREERDRLNGLLSRAWQEIQCGDLQELQVTLEEIGDVVAEAEEE